MRTFAAKTLSLLFLLITRGEKSSLTLSRSIAGGGQTKKRFSARRERGNFPLSASVSEELSSSVNPDCPKIVLLNNCAICKIPLWSPITRNISISYSVAAKKDTLNSSGCEWRGKIPIFEGPLQLLLGEDGRVWRRRRDLLTLSGRPRNNKLDREARKGSQIAADE